MKRTILLARSAINQPARAHRTRGSGQNHRRHIEHGRFADIAAHRHPATDAADPVVTPGPFSRADPGHFSRASKVVPDPERFPLVKRLWRELLAGGTTVPELWHRAAFEWGLTTRGNRRAPSSPIKVDHLYLIFRNRFYTGQVIHDGEAYAGEHTPMVTPGEFDRVREIIGGASPCPSKHRFVFAGLLHCGHCDGRLLTGEVHARGDRRHVYYRCGRRRAGYGICTSPPAREDNLTTELETALSDLALPEPLVDWSLEFIDCWSRDEKRFARDVARSKKVELAKVDAQLERLADLVVAGMLDKDSYLPRRMALLQRREELRATIASPGDDVEKWRHLVREVLTSSAKFGAAFQKGTIDQRRMLLGRVYANITVTDRKPAPTLRFPYTVLAETRPVVESGSGRYANMLEPAEMAAKLRKSPSTDGTGFYWCTSLLRLRTATDPAEVGFTVARSENPA